MSKEGNLITALRERSWVRRAKPKVPDLQALLGEDIENADEWKSPKDEPKDHQTHLECQVNSEPAPQQEWDGIAQEWTDISQS